MTQSGFGVDPEELRAFSRGLRERGGEVDTAAKSANGVKLGTETFGVLLGGFSTTLNMYADAMVERINELAKSVDSAADQVKEAADTYENTDLSNSEELDTLGGM